MGDEGIFGRLHLLDDGNSHGIEPAVEAEEFSHDWQNCGPLPNCRLKVLADK
jgi:hypothetical protein